MIRGREQRKRPGGAQGDAIAASFPFLGTLILILLLPVPSRAQVHLTGIVELDAGYISTISKTNSSKETSTNRQLLQRYQVGATGVILDPRFASYVVTIGLQDSTFKTEPFAGQTTRVSRDTTTYSLQLNLFPTRWPFNLYAQRNIIGSESTGDLIADTFSLNWILNLRDLPTLRVTLLQLGTELQDPTSPRKTRIRIANIGLDQRFKRTSLFFNYQLTDYLIRDTTGETSSTVNSFALRGESYLTPELFAHANATYFPKGSVFAPGLTSTSETSGGAGLLHQIPHRSQSVNYDFFDAAATDLRRDTLSYNITYRPLGKTDYQGDAVFATTRSPAGDATDYRVGGGLNHRPFFGLGLNGSVVLNHTDISGSTSASRDRVSLSGGVNYFRPLDYFNFNSGYLADYSFVHSNQAGEEGNVVSQNIILGLQTRTLRTTQINGAYSFLWRENHITSTDNRKEHALHLGLIDNSFRRLILRGSTDLQYTDSLGIKGTTFIFDSRADFYPWPVLDTAAGYRYSNFPESVGTQDITTTFLEGRYVLLLLRNLNLTLTAHWDRDEYSFLEKNRYLFNGVLNYILGRVTFSLDSRYEVTKYPGTDYIVESIFLRASRPF